MGDFIIKILLENQILLLFSVAAIGYAIGEIKILGFNLGISAILFTGLFFGALHPDLKLPEYIYTLGLVLFVYTVGLSNGPGFFASIKKRGLKDNVFSLSIILSAIALTYFISKYLDIEATYTSGLFTGSMTNTPALAGLIDYMKINLQGEELQKITSEPVVAYSVAYPFGIIGAMLAIYLFQAIWKINYSKEAENLKIPGVSNEKFINQTILITKDTSEPILKIIKKNKWNISAVRLKSGDHISLIADETKPKIGDYISIVGNYEEVKNIISFFGEASSERLEYERKEIDFRRIFVSNSKISGLKLSELDLPHHFGAIVTRVRRGDIDFIATADTTVELGDRVRVVAPREKMDELSKFFGDSYKALSEVNVMTFGLGIALGLILGYLPIPLPNGTFFKLGFAGGPLIVGLIFGVLGRTGSFIWNLPYNANLTLRQLGLILFLAGIGTKAGYSFFSVLGSSLGLHLFLAGALITFTISTLILTIGYKVLKIPMNMLLGMLAGIQTQPALLAFACERTKNEIPNVGYATVYPLATISKIILVQILFSFINK